MSAKPEVQDSGRAPGDVYRDTARSHDGTYATFTLREPGVSGPAVNFEGMAGWHGTRSDFGEWFVTDYSLSNFYEAEET